MKTKREIFIIGVHQSYAKSFAGGYIRLREFLKRIPSDIEYKVIDVSPTIYKDLISKDKILEFNNPSIIKFFISFAFPIGVILERVYSIIAIYKILGKHIKDGNVLIYVPIAELLHLYIPSILIKRKYKNIKIIVDILNFEIIDESFISLIKRFRTSTNLIISIGLAFIHYFSFNLTRKTINNVDYIFTVSPELVNVIRQIYKKKSIDFTPSGVSINYSKPKRIKKVFIGVYIGRVTEQKGIFNLLRVWKMVIEKKPDAKIAIAGLVNPDTLNIVKRNILNYKLENNVKLFGEVSEEEKYNILSESEIFLHLANYEPLFPVIGILEGLSFGLPVVVFDMKVINPELKKHANNEFLNIVENGNIEKATHAVINYINSSENHKKTTSEKAMIYAKKFDWNTIAQKEFRIILQLIKNSYD